MQIISVMGLEGVEVGTFGKSKTRNNFQLLKFQKCILSRTFQYLIALLHSNLPLKLNANNFLSNYHEIFKTSFGRVESTENNPRGGVIPTGNNANTGE